MAQPEGFTAPGQEHLVCRLKKSLYGLKQSPRQWYQKLHSTFVDLGFSRCASDHCVWVWAKDGIKVIPAYVDDLTIACNNTPTLTHIKEQLSSRYKMHDLGPKLLKSDSHCPIYYFTLSVSSFYLHRFRCL